MPILVYNLDVADPALFNRLKLPTVAVAVRYNGDVLSRTAIDTTGTIVMDIPQELIDGVHRGKVKVAFLTQHLPSQMIEEVGRTEQLNVIEIREA